MLTIKQFAEKTGLSYGTVAKKIREGKLPNSRVKKHVTHSIEIDERYVDDFKAVKENWRTKKYLKAKKILEEDIKPDKTILQLMDKNNIPF